ncbi:hypothetical protein R1sor_003632 [Riccia sorocarpa]|uniref:Uncharacterized protein n=1 Tax=Riccia sorocarpa TaxID=122646 RepID=A0ABD3H5L6_9MARC
MDVKEKAEPGRVGSSPEGGSSGVRDGEVLSGSQESSKKVEAPNAVGVEDWNEEDFILSIEYFAKDCNLPNEGMMPGDIPKTLERHRNQLRSSKSRREPKPIGPPILRVHRVYKPPPNLSLEPGETEERAPSPVDRNLKGATTIDAKQEAPAAAEEGISSEPSEVKPEVLLRGSSSRTSCLPVYVELKDDIAARENSIKDIHANISSDTEALEVLRSSTKSAAESIALSVGTYKTDKEDMNLLQSLEAEEEDLNLSLSEVLTKIEECSARLLQSQTEMKLSRSKLEELKMELERAELKVDNAQVVLRKEEALLAFQKEELRCLQPFAESSVAPLIPRWIPTATEVGVEHTILTSAAATKVRGISPCSTILSEREEDLRDLDVSLVDTSPVPRTRSKSGKRNLPKGDSVRKVRTRSQRPRNRIEVCQLAPSESMAGDTQSRFLGILDITKCWGPSEGQLTYAGCGRLLRDGRPCGLGLRARKTKESAACSANSQSGVVGSQISSQMGTPVNKSRDRAGHICSQSGEEVQLFHFFIETAEPRHELEVWERAGQELLKMTGQEFFEKYGRDRHSLHKFVSTHLASTPSGYHSHWETID